MPDSISSPLPPTRRRLRAAARHRLEDRVGDSFAERRQGKQSKPRITSAMSARSPASQTRSPSLCSATRASTLARSGPSPTSARRRSSPARRTLQRAQMREQMRQVLHRVHAANPADEQVLGIAERAALDRHAPWRAEALGVHSVADVRDARRRHADLALEVVLEVMRQRDVAAHERAVQAPHDLVAAPAASGSFRFQPCSPWMRTGTPAAHAGTAASSAARLRMHDRRLELPEEAIEPRIVAHQAGRLSSSTNLRPGSARSAKRRHVRSETTAWRQRSRGIRFTRLTSRSRVRPR